MLDEEFAEMNREEERGRRSAAKVFRGILADDNHDALRDAAEYIGSFTLGGWPYAMRAALKVETISDEMRYAFQNLWIEHKGLPFAVGSRPLMAKVLRHLLPPQKPLPAPLIVYRGTTMSERKRRLYGFSWSSSREIATRFADRWGKTPFGGLVLSTELPADAVLLDRQDDDYYAERELVVDPYKLGRVKIVERFGPLALSR